MKQLIYILLFFFLGSHNLFGLVRYSLPCNPELLKLSNEYLIKQVGVREKSDNNDGVEIEKYLASVGLRRGAPYCAAGQYWCFLQASKILHLERSDIPIYRTGSTAKMFGEARQIGVKTSAGAKVNDLIFWRRPNDWRGHVERIIAVGKAGWVTTVGFNTSSGQRGSQRDGNGVFQRQRNINHFLGRMVVHGFIGFNK